jgi:hypothetical protein
VTLLRRILSRKVSVEAMIEVAMWLAIPYLIIGIGWAFVNPDYIKQVDSQLQTRLPAGSNIVAFGSATALWPFLLLAPDVCAP